MKMWRVRKGDNEGEEGHRVTIFTAAERGCCRCGRRARAHCLNGSVVIYCPFWRLAFLLRPVRAPRPASLCAPLRSPRAPDRSCWSPRDSTTGVYERPDPQFICQEWRGWRSELWACLFLTRWRSPLLSAREAERFYLSPAGQRGPVVVGGRPRQNGLV